MFSRYRTHMRLYAGLIYASFAAVDFLYMPEKAPLWLALRLIFVAYIWGSFGLLAKRAFYRRRIEWFAIGAVFVACSPINFMIYQSGGYESLYVPGLILCTITGIQIFRLDRVQAAVAQALSYLPAMCIILATAGLTHMKTAAIVSSFLFGMMVLSWVYGSSDEAVTRAWLKSRAATKRELERLRKTEFLKSHFPQHIREEIEQGTLILSKQTLVPGAVVGFADIVSSTRISNSVDLFTDWQLKERFLEAATLRATQSGMVVLTHLGDGFLFLANYRSHNEWHFNLISFYENLTSDFKKILASLESKIGPIESGVRFGVTTGPAIVGWLGNNQSYFTAMGPDVNLASRLCANAGHNEIVISGRVWEGLKSVMNGWSTERKIYANLKGFDQEIPAVHIRPRLSAKKVQLCPICGSELAIVKTPEGFIDLQCTQSHDKLPQNFVA